MTADGPKNPLELLEEASHLPPGTAKQIFEEVKRNHALLDACSGPHDFTPYERYGDSPNSPVRTYKCSRCQGTVGSSEARWYQKGLEHSQKR